jgi:predicted ATPase
LCGRTKETLTLLKAYQTVLQNRNEALSKAVLVIHGESGTGKTSLVESALRNPVSESNGYFCAGKFAQQCKWDGRLLVSQEPYSAIMAAFSDLCDLVLQSSDFDSRRRMEIQQALGTDASLLVGAISNLSPFLDANFDNQFGLLDTTNKTILARFKIACKRFLRAMSSDQHPIVLFLDDIQWMDEGSRQLNSRSDCR